jgi:ABC-type antimicrobial peptide transport system permease subunit
VGSPADARLRSLDALLKRVVLIVEGRGGVPLSDLRSAVLREVALDPLDVRDVEGEMARLGSDMYIFLARANIGIFLFGGLVLALVGFTAIASVNYVEDRRTLALLRVRGAGPREILRFFLPGMLGPSLIGIVAGVLISFGVGFGIAKLIWKFRELQTVLGYIPDRLVLSTGTGLTVLFLLVAVGAIAWLSGRWVFTRTVQRGLAEA